MKTEKDKTARLRHALVKAHEAVVLKTKIKKLRGALEAAKRHLEYCSYGDHWERECARQEKLEEKIDAALSL